MKAQIYNGQVVNLLPDSYSGDNIIDIISIDNAISNDDIKIGSTYIEDSSLSKFIIENGVLKYSISNYAQYEIKTEKIIGSAIWNKYPKLSIGRQGACGGIIDGFFHIFGGQNQNGDYVSSHEFIDLNNDVSWTAQYPVPDAFEEAGFAVIETKAYIYGGYGSSYRNTVYEYDSTNGNYTTKNNLPIATKDIQVCTDGIRYNYLMGGEITGDTLTDNVYQHDTYTDTYNIITDIPYPRKDGAVALINNTLIYIGGLQNGVSYPGTNVYTYDLSQGLSGSWKTKKEAPMYLSGAGTVVYNGIMYLIGGYSKESTTSTDSYNDKVLAYNPEIDIWWIVGILPRGVEEMVCDVVDNVIIGMAGLTKIYNSRNVLEQNIVFYLG